jgi:hypothetical protein
MITFQNLNSQISVALVVKLAEKTQNLKDFQQNLIALDSLDNSLYLRSGDFKASLCEVFPPLFLFVAVYLDLNPKDFQSKLVEGQIPTKHFLEAFFEFLIQL